VHELSNYNVAVLAPTFPSDSASAAARRLRRSYVSRWTQLVRDAQSAGVLAREPDPRLLRDLIFGALNAVSLAGRPSGDTADALRALLGLARINEATNKPDSFKASIGCPGFETKSRSRISLRNSGRARRPLPEATGELG
jgi:Tetracyclin repressor-like, C-terminal domain